MFELRIENNKVWVTKRETLTTYSEGYEAVQIRPDFGPEWDNLSKIAVFRAYDAQIDLAMTDTTVEVPLQVLLKPNVHLFFGIYGISATGTVVIPTVWADLGIIQAGADPWASDNVGTPTPELFAQMATLVAQAQQAASDAATAQYAGSVSFSINSDGHLIVEATSEGTTVEADLGAVTAYAEAVAAGYTGTYAQFQTMLKSAQDAADAATAAAAAATAAQEAAEGVADTAATANSNASAALTAASAAQTAATTAQTAVSGKQAQHKTATVTLEIGQTTWGKSVTGVTASNLVIWGPAPASFDAAQEFGVRMTEQAAGSVTFTATAATDEAITMNLAIFD